MKTSDKFKEYIWLVNTIYRAGRISFAKIQKKWLETEMSNGMGLARSTFNRHKDAIEDIFGIFIDCDRLDKYQYFIGNNDVLTDESVQNWMLSTLAVSNEVGESMSLQNRIMLESIPSEHGRLADILDAMKQKVCLRIKYQKYGQAEVKEVEMAPYCIKLFKRRWYVVGNLTPENPERGSYRMYSFDRIKGLEHTATKFEVPEGFDAKELFKDYYGVMMSQNTVVESIVVRAYNNERFYVRDLPMHSSQREVGEGDGYVDFELRMHPTPDFFSHVLSRSSQLQVLSPQWLADEIRKMLRDALDRYE
ncbi:MAG: WYL domain-containing protein [Bacteroidaceae bacterium]|nr:WYL domain-containing protein [Bacteroidaceae bacterium]